MKAFLKKMKAISEVQDLLDVKATSKVQDLLDVVLLLVFSSGQIHVLEMRRYIEQQSI